MNYTVIKPEQPLEHGHFVFEANDTEYIIEAYRAAQDYGMVLKRHEVSKDFYVIMKSVYVHVIPHNGNRNMFHYERLINDRQ